MLAFTLNQKPFILSKDTSVRFTWRNPACNFESFPGDVGLGISVPVNDTNRALLGNPERFEKYASENDREFENFEIRFSGKLLMSGTLVIQNASIETYSGWLRSNLGNLGKEYREQFIYDSKSFDEDHSFENKANYDPESDHYGCPKIFNPYFFAEKGKKITLQRKIPNPDFVDRSWFAELFGTQEPEFIEESYETENLTEAFRKSAAWHINHQNPDNTIKLTDDSANVDVVHEELECLVVTPMLFLNHVIRTILQDSWFAVNNSFLETDPDLKTLLLYNNYDITFMDFLVQTNFWFNQHETHDGVMTQSYSEQIQLFTRNYTATFKYKNLLPKVTLKDFILSIQNLLNVCFFFRQDSKVDIIDREAILAGTAFDISKYMVNNWEINEKLDNTLKFTFKHDDNDTLFSERWENIEDRRTDVGDPVDDWPDLEAIETPIIGEIRYITSRNLYAQYQWNQKVEIDPVTGGEIQTDMIGWFLIAFGFQNGYANYGKDNQENIETEFSTLIGDAVPSTYQKGNLESIRYAYNNFSPRLLFYLGNNSANFETPNISLDWEKAGTGLLATRHKTWSRFWAKRQPVTGKAILPLNILDYVIRNIPFKFRAREGEFIIEQLETTFGINNIGISTFKGYKI